MIPNEIKLKSSNNRNEEKLLIQRNYYYYILICFTRKSIPVQILFKKKLKKGKENEKIKTQC